eukprot:96487_1
MVVVIVIIVIMLLLFIFMVISHLRKRHRNLYTPNKWNRNEIHKGIKTNTGYSPPMIDHVMLTTRKSYTNDDDDQLYSQNDEIMQYNKKPIVKKSYDDVPNKSITKNPKKSYSSKHDIVNNIQPVLDLKNSGLDTETRSKIIKPVDNSILDVKIVENKNESKHDSVVLNWNKQNVLEWIKTINLKPQWEQIVVNAIQTTNFSGEDLSQLKSAMDVSQLFGIDNKMLCSRISRELKKVK